MKIAVTYENGEVFQHFGHTQEFKIYNVEDNKVVSSEILGSDGQGHGALATLLSDNDIDVLICGGIGGGAMSALNDNNIEVFAGASGSTDDVVASFLEGALESTGVNCDHHGEGHSCHDHEDGHSCGHHSDLEESEGGCASGGCSGCAGCHSTPTVEGKNAGKTCKAHYRGTFNDGTQFDSSYDRGEPLEFVCGSGMMIHGFDAAVANMEVGEKVNVHLMPEEAYGEVDPDCIVTVKIAEMPGSENLQVNDQAYLQDMYGSPIPVKIVAKDDTTITFDANHEMAGKELNFEIELMEVV